jgi:hypothetical protein
MKRRVCSLVCVCVCVCLVDVAQQYLTNTRCRAYACISMPVCVRAFLYLCISVPWFVSVFCVLFAVSFCLLGNVLVMSFIGRGGWAAPQLRGAKLSLRMLQNCYVQVVLILRALYEHCRLVHADLSEYVCACVVHSRQQWRRPCNAACFSLPCGVLSTSPHQVQHTLYVSS